MTKQKARKNKKLFDKYLYYHAAVQSPEAEVDFFRQTYKEIRNKKPALLTEDFCGTFGVACDWVKRSKEHRAVAVDLDPEPLAYGRQHYYNQLSKQQKSAIQVINDNVLNRKLPKSDIVAALNFSCFIFKTRNEMRAYFESAYCRLKKQGLFIIDCFGGKDCLAPREEETEHDGFSYFWDQDSFNPTNRHAQFYIHFKRKGESKRKKVFSYDWRLWDIPELRDIMTDAGFSDTVVYWEGTDQDGDGDGEYRPTQLGDDRDAWICYIVGIK
jgi:hypothetical protein